MKLKEITSIKDKRDLICDYFFRVRTYESYFYIFNKFGNYYETIDDMTPDRIKTVIISDDYSIIYNPEKVGKIRKMNNSWRE